MAKNSQNSFLGVAWACQISGPWSPGKEKKRRPWPGLSQFEFGLSFSHTPTAPGHIPATALSALTAPEYVLIRILWSIGFDYQRLLFQQRLFGLFLRRCSLSHETSSSRRQHGPWPGLTPLEVRRGVSSLGHHEPLFARGQREYKTAPHKISNFIVVVQFYKGRHCHAPKLEI